MLRFLVIAAVLVLASCSYYYVNSDNETLGIAPQQYEQLPRPPEFSKIKNITARKKAFFKYMRKGVTAENARVSKERDFLLALKEKYQTDSVTPRDLVNAKLLGELYNVKLEKNALTKDWLKQMLLRVDVLPEALVLTQAANESAWGTSRFARQANNYFGQWCYSKGCGLVPLDRADGMTHEVAKFSSVSESIHRYFMNVNRNRAYKTLRQIRAQLRTKGESVTTTFAAIQLVKGLNKYSERGEEYVQDIQAMIDHNQEYWLE